MTPKERKLTREFDAILRNTAEDLETGAESIKNLRDAHGKYSVDIQESKLMERVQT